MTQEPVEWNVMGWNNRGEGTNLEWNWHLATEAWGENGMCDKKLIL